jgi:DNA topoisomerase-1
MPEEFWVIAAELASKKGGKQFEAKFYGFDGKKSEIKNKEQADDVLQRAKDGAFTVTDLKTAEKSKHAPAPFTTSNLQQEASRKLNFTTKHTMLIAQQLYEGIELQGKEATGLITYIRTDSVRIADEAQQQAREYIQKQYGDRYLPEKPNIYKGRKGAQDAHEAIRPAHIEFTPQSVKASLNSNQYKLYKLIYERFIASQMSEAKYEHLRFY